MRISAVLMLLAALPCVSGCYLVHERVDVVDAFVSPDAGVNARRPGHDAFVPPDVGRDAYRWDTGPGDCPIPGVCEGVAHTIMLDRVSHEEGDEACRVVDLDVHAPLDADGCRGATSFAVATCVGVSVFTRVTVTRVGPGSRLGIQESGAVGCRCGTSMIDNDPEVGDTLRLAWNSGEEMEGVDHFAIVGEDISVQVTACAR